MKYLLTILLLWGVAYGQSTVYLRADNVKVMKQGGNAVLIIENATRDSTGGVLYNIANGVTAFRKSRAINDSQFWVGGDTITLRGASGSGQNFVNADLRATENRSHNFSGNNLTIDSLGVLYFESLLSGERGELLLQPSQSVLAQTSEANFTSNYVQAGQLGVRLSAQNILDEPPSDGHTLLVSYDSITLRNWRSWDTTQIYLGTLLPIGDTLTGNYVLVQGSDKRMKKIPVSWLLGGGSSSSDSLATLINANGGGYLLINRQTIDTLKIKNLLAGTRITLDSTATGITINSTPYTFSYGLTEASSVVKVDTNSISTRAWRQKGIDSIGSLLVTASNGLTKTSNDIKLGGTLTGATNISPNGNELTILTDNLGTSPTNSSGINLVNTTDAAAGAQQISPSLRFRGEGWKTTATAATQVVDVRMHVTPIQGTTAPTFFFDIQGAINAGTYWNLIRFYSGGGLTVQGTGGTNGGLSFGSATPTANTILSGTQLVFQTTGTTSNTAFVMNPNSGFTNTSGNLHTLELYSGGTTGFAPTSGGATYSTIHVNPIINQTGSANGVSRGVYINPVLTSVTGEWRAIDIVTGKTYIKSFVTGHATALTSANYTVGNDDFTVKLPDLTTEAANRNVVMPTATAGRKLQFINVSSDATFKWSFSTVTVQDAAGAAVTTLTDQKVYTLTADGSIWIVTSVY